MGGRTRRCRRPGTKTRVRLGIDMPVTPVYKRKSEEARKEEGSLEERKKEERVLWLPLSVFNRVGRNIKKTHEDKTTSVDTAFHADPPAR